jgi:hypothetical protein
MKLATLRDREVNDLGDDVVFLLDRGGEAVLGPPLVLEQVDSIFREQPGDVQPDVRDGDFAQHFTQAGSVVGIRVG